MKYEDETNSESGTLAIEIESFYIDEAKIDIQEKVDFKAINDHQQMHDLISQMQEKLLATITQKTKFFLEQKKYYAKFHAEFQQKYLQDGIIYDVMKIQNYHFKTIEASSLQTLQQIGREIEATSKATEIKIQELHLSYKKVIEKQLMLEINRINKSKSNQAGNGKLAKMLHAHKLLENSCNESELRYALFKLSNVCQIERNNFFYSFGNTKTYANLLKTIKLTPYLEWFAIKKVSSQPTTKLHLYRF